MGTVKAFDIGNVNIDLPSPNYYFSLPLFNVSTLKDEINISLIFNLSLARNNNASFLSIPGYKINYQKQIIFENNYPGKFVDEYGNILSLKRNDNIYTFYDDSQRIIHFVNNTFELLYIDYSKDIFDSSGKLSKSINKYGEEIFSFNYDNLNKLISITYRNEKTFLISYINDVISSISYDSKNILFAIDNNNITLSNYNDATISLSFNDDNFSASGTITTDNQNYNKEIIVEKDLNNIDCLSLTYKTNNIIQERLLYCFNDSIIDSTSKIKYSNLYKIVDISNKKNVSYRIEFSNKKILYYYEIDNDKNYLGGNVTLFNATNEIINTSVSGIFKVDSGKALTLSNSNNQTYYIDNSMHYNPNESGYFILSFWAKANTNNYIPDIIISPGGGNIAYQFSLNNINTSSFTFYAFKFKLDSNFIYVSPSLSSALELDNVRLIYKTSHVCDNSSYQNKVALSNLVLFDHVNNNFLELSDISFHLDGINIYSLGEPSLNDLIRLIINKRKNIYTDEIYLNNGKDVIKSNNELKINYIDNLYPLSNFYFVKQDYTSKGLISCFYVDDDVDAFFKIVTKDKNNNILNEKTFDNDLDLINEIDGNLTSIRQKTNNIVTSITLSDNEFNNISSSFSISNDDNHLSYLITDEFNNTFTYEYDSSFGNIISILNPNNEEEILTYDDSSSFLIKRTFSPSNKEISYSYQNNKLKSVSHENLSFLFNYQNDDEISVLKNNNIIKESDISDTEERDYYPSKTNTSYQNKITYDKYNRLLSFENVLTNTYRSYSYFNNDNQIISNVDNSDSHLVICEDHLSSQITKYGYNDFDLLNKIATFNSDNTKIKEEIFSYDNASRLIERQIFFGNIQIKENKNYLFDVDHPLKDDRLSEIAYSFNNNVIFSSNFTYDSFKRIKEKNRTLSNINFKDTFSYNKTLPSCLSKFQNNIRIHHYDLNYDFNKRITSISDLDTNYHNSYAYDEFGRLCRENNVDKDASLLYSYDDYGNIINVKKYNYSNGELNTLISQDNFSYDNCDRLISFNNKTISYDSNNRLSSYDGWSYSYFKNRLSSISKIIPMNNTKTRKVLIKESFSYSFSYNAFGQRTRKKYTHENFNDVQLLDYLTSEIHDYEYDSSSRLLKEDINLVYSDNTSYSKTIVFIYEGDEIIGFRFTSNNVTNTYYYDKSPLGDVLHIIDINGNVVANYRYDAFGNCDIVNSSNYEVATYNPIRYRSYYYDENIKLYYLNSRYYNPLWRRFISPDSTSYLDIETIAGLNLYSYCRNDPINKYDPTGHFGIWALVAITAASMLIGGTAQLVSNVMAGKTGSELWRGVVGAAIGAGVNALVLCLAMPTGGASLFIAAGASAIAQTGVDTLETVIRDEEVDIGHTFIDLGLNFVTTLAGNYLGGKMIPTNPGWFQPQKFLSVFTKSYGQKILLQTAIGAGLSGTVNFIRKNDWSRYKPIIPMPVLPLYPLF